MVHNKYELFLLMDEAISDPPPKTLSLDLNFPQPHNLGFVVHSGMDPANSTVPFLVASEIITFQ